MSVDELRLMSADPRLGTQQLARVRGSLIRHARRRGASCPQDAEDAAQEAICRALERRVDADHLEAWLYVVTGNLVMDILRYRRRVKADVTPDEVHLSGRDLFDEIEDAEIARVAQMLIVDLPVPQKGVLLAIFKGETIRQYAAQDGGSVRSAEGHLTRARKSLRQRLA